MHGKNEVRKGIEGDGSTLQVHSIWRTIQGEGPFSGWPAIFIRLTGCNLRCWFCDTQWDDEGDPTMTVGAIVDQVREKSMSRQGRVIPGLVVITGGEPTRQDLRALIPSLIDAGYHVQIETDGLFWQPVMDMAGVTIVVSPKTPKIDRTVWDKAQAFKYVLRFGEIDPEDGLPSASTQRKGEQARIARPRPGAPVFVTPCDEGEDDVEGKGKLNPLVVGQVALKHGYIAQVQVHKIIDLP